MIASTERQKFRNEDLVLKVSKAVDRAKWDESRYEAFIDQLCGSREYQKEAIRITLRYLMSGEYESLRDLARVNYKENEILKERYGSWDNFEGNLQFPDQLSASLDLATATGKSYILYGIAAILLAEGAVDRVLVLCPSTTIETGLLEKFELLAGDSDLRDLLPANAKIATPRIINASESITEGSICVENYHAILEHVGSSIRDSLYKKGGRVAVLNDEAHHVANEASAKTKKWKEFLANADFGFKYIIGVSGTCYVGDDYFVDVIFRYSLRQAMEENYAKLVNYVAEMPKTKDPDEKWQLIYNHHEETKRNLKPHKLLPLTIIVTPTIERCKNIADELKAFLVETGGLKLKAAEERMLIVYNNAPDVVELSHIDNPTSEIEWIVSVSMLNEGWDVKRVFQIVPHEERAFNSKLLIAQVLGRGLRIPDNWKGPQPEVIVFNHDAWANRIQDLVNEVLDIEKRVTTRIIEDSKHHFDLYNIDYAIEPISVKKPMDREYKLFSKGFIELATDVPSEEVIVEFERAKTEERYKWQTMIQHKTCSPKEIALEMFKRLKDADEENIEEGIKSTSYTKKYSVDFLEEVVKKSLLRAKIRDATENIKQRFLQSLGTLRRKSSENVRYTLSPKSYLKLSTKDRQADSVSAGELKRDKTIFVTDQTRPSLKGEQIEFFDEISESGSGFKCIPILNRNDFKSPLNAVIADSENEKRFIKLLLEPNNLRYYDAWIKSTAMRFYEIDYAWKKGEHPKRGKFSPDIFIKTGRLVLVVEIKGDEEIKDPSEENIKKNEYTISHFKKLNKYLDDNKIRYRYKFNFLTQIDFNKYFQYLRECRIKEFHSELDVKLSENI